jgi:hypothetical protein
MAWAVRMRHTDGVGSHLYVLVAEKSKALRIAERNNKIYREHNDPRGEVFYVEREATKECSLCGRKGVSHFRFDYVSKTWRCSNDSGCMKRRQVKQ